MSTRSRRNAPSIHRSSRHLQYIFHTLLQHSVDSLKLLISCIAHSAALRCAILKGGALALLVFWTIVANTLVFVVLYKNPRLQTVPNLLVANLAFSDLCLGIIVLPLSSIYAVANEWLFTSTLCVVFVSADILCSTASIWNLSIVGLDRYWAITTPTAYMAKRNKRTAALLILSVWFSSALISLAPLVGWKQIAERGNMVTVNGTWQCVFLDLPSYTIYSATGSFFIPLAVMFFVYYKIYQAFAEHRARQLYRQKVIRKHIESTILHELSHVLPTSDEFAKDADSGSESISTMNVYKQSVGPIREEEEECLSETAKQSNSRDTRTILSDTESSQRKTTQSLKFQNERSVTRSGCAKENGSVKSRHCGSRSEIRKKRLVQHAKTSPKLEVTYEQIRCHSKRLENPDFRSNLQHKPKTISAAKERRGVKVLGIILGCFTICWTPFFIMYVVMQFCSSCEVNPHIWMFITWLGYSNSAMNPIIYTVHPFKVPKLEVYK